MTATAAIIFTAGVNLIMTHLLTQLSAYILATCPFHDVQTDEVNIVKYI